MPDRRSLGRQFRRLYTAYTVSTLGTWFAFDAFSLVAILVLHAGPSAVSALAAVGLAVGAAAAIPLGPWIEARRKRPVMVAMDLIRFAALITIPVAFGLGRLAYPQLLAVAVVVAAADIAFTAASGACLKALVPREDLLTANAWFESTTWTATVVGPPLGGLAIGVFGPVATVVANAVSFVLSAAGIRAIGGHEPQPAHASAGTGGTSRLAAHDVLDGWRHILAHPALRPLLLNALLNNGLIMAASPLMAVLMLGRLGFAPWQYGLAFAVPCVGGLIGARLARRLVARYGQRTVLLTAGTLRACWPAGLAFVRPGVAGLILVFGVQFGLVACSGVYNPVLSTYRLAQTPDRLVARVLSAWSVTTRLSVAACTALWGLLAGLTTPRTAIAAAGVLLLATPLLLPREMGAEVIGAGHDEVDEAEPTRALESSRE